MVYSQIMETMWLDLFDSSFIGSLAILAIFAYICFKKQLGAAETMIVVFPVLIGVTTAGCFGTTSYGCVPGYFGGIVILAIGILWGLALTKAINSFEGHIRLYIIFICANAALAMYNYDLCGTISQSEPAIVSWTSVTGILTAAQGILGFLAGSSISGFFRCSGLPSSIATFMSYSVTTIAVVLIFGMLDTVFRILNYWKAIVVILAGAAGVAALSWMMG